MIELGDDNGSGISRSLFIGNSGITPIDLTSALLDSRVSYSGPSHAYRTQSGALAYTSANEWPLEFVNGVPVGRHEPEKATTNYQPSTEFGSIGVVGTSSVDWIYSSGAMISVADSDLGLDAATMDASSVLTAVYSESTGGFIAAASDGGTPANWGLVTRQFTNGQTSMLRWYIARASASLYLYGRTASVPAGSYIASVYRKLTGAGLLSAAAQVEPGTIATSPVIAGVGESASRAASSVNVARDGNATGITLKFSNGSTADIDFSGDVISIPVSALNWSTRYIQTIEYRS